jgi:hypothetical protein
MLCIYAIKSCHSLCASAIKNARNLVRPQTLAKVVVWPVAASLSQNRFLRLCGITFSIFLISACGTCFLITGDKRGYWSLRP